jgi:hypothetical protein
MLCAIPRKLDRLALGVICCWLLAAGVRGQSTATLHELSKLHERIADPQKVLTASDARQAMNRLAEWKLTPEKLSPADRARLKRIELYIALADGNAKTALEHAQSLLSEFPDDPAACEAAYLAACAAGDAKLGSDMLRQLARSATGDRRRLISQRRRWIRGVGKEAPEVEIRTEDMTAFETARRGDRVLLIDFWNVLGTREDDTSAALRALHDEYQYSPHVDFVGVNADAEAQVPEAKEFAKERRYSWKQRYEYVAADAPITHQAFRAGNPPWQVLIDTFGYIRAVGSVAEPAFQYALRAAVAEAGGDYAAVMPRTRDGQQPERPSAQVEPTAPRKPKSDDQDQELPSNPDAQAKLSQARVFLKAKNRSKAIELFREIVRDYPGTQEAREAQEYLDSLSP